MFRKLTALGLLTLCLVGASAPAHAADILVNPGDSIQAAIDRAFPGDSIHIAPATYFETLLIPPRKAGLSLFGRGAILDAYPAPQPGVGEAKGTHGAALVIEANNVLVSGLCIVNARDGQHPVLGKSAGDGVRVHADGVTLGSLVICNVEGLGVSVVGNEVQLLDLTVTGAGRGGLAVAGNQVSVRKCRVDGQGLSDDMTSGLKLGPGIRLLVEGNEFLGLALGLDARDAVDLIVRANRFRELGIGFMLLNSPSTEISQNRFDNVSTGIQLFASPSSQIRSNRFVEYDYGIRTLDPAAKWEEGVACQHPAIFVGANRFRGGRAGDDPLLPAAALSATSASCPVIATGNLVRASAGFGLDIRAEFSLATENRILDVHGVALMLTGDRLLAEQNRISGAGVGILVQALGSNILVSKNVIEGIRRDGIAVFGELLGGRIIRSDELVHQVLGKVSPPAFAPEVTGIAKRGSPAGGLPQGGRVTLSGNTVRQVLGKGLMLGTAAEVTGNTIVGAMGEGLALDVLTGSVRLTRNVVECSRTPVTDALFGAGIIDGGGNVFDMRVDLTHLPAPMLFTH